MSWLYIMCGVSGAGKTTFAKQYFDENIKYISRDEIRFSLVSPEEEYFSKETQVFKIFTNRIQKALDEGFDVVADATHLNMYSRIKLIKALNMKGHHAAAVVVNASLATCLKHNEDRKGTRSYVPEGQIK